MSKEGEREVIGEAVFDPKPITSKPSRRWGFRLKSLAFK